jgi:hypothetical protein
VNNKSSVVCASVRSVVALTLVAILGAVSAQAQPDALLFTQSGLSPFEVAFHPIEHGKIELGMAGSADPTRR